MKSSLLYSLFILRTPESRAPTARSEESQIVRVGSLIHPVLLVDSLGVCVAQQDSGFHIVRYMYSTVLSTCLPVRFLPAALPYAHTSVLSGKLSLSR
jgi:hypothetical protein